MGSTMVMFDATQHLVSNEMVEIDGDTATVRAMFYNPMHFAATTPATSTAAVGTTTNSSAPATGGRAASSGKTSPGPRWART